MPVDPAAAHACSLLALGAREEQTLGQKNRKRTILSDPRSRLRTRQAVNDRRRGDAAHRARSWALCVDFIASNDAPEPTAEADEKGIARGCAECGAAARRV
jgi:hypothetical protein